MKLAIDPDIPEELLGKLTRDAFAQLAQQCFIPTPHFTFNDRQHSTMVARGLREGPICKHEAHHWQFVSGGSERN